MKRTFTRICEVLVIFVSGCFTMSQVPRERPTKRGIDDVPSAIFERAKERLVQRSA
jgi:hypothetical protein